MVVENSSDYAFHVNSDGQLQINHLYTADTDILIGMEKLVFADKILDVSASNLDAATLKLVVGLYRLETGTAPTLAQLNKIASQALTIPALTEQLTHEASYQSLWTGLNNAQFVSRLSTAVLGTPLTGADQAYWLDQLENGLTREHVFIAAVGVTSYQSALFGGEGGGDNGIKVGWGKYFNLLPPLIVIGLHDNRSARFA